MLLTTDNIILSKGLDTLKTDTKYLLDIAL